MLTRKIDAYSKRYGSKRATKKASPARFEQERTLLTTAENCWQSLAGWRDEIRRNERYAYGDQWSDRVYDAKSHEYKSERRMMQEQGVQPSQYNIIKNLLSTITGVWSGNKTLPTCVAQKDENQEESEILTATLHTLYRKNELWRLDMNMVSQLLISGVIITKNHYQQRDGEADVVNDYVSPFRFFIDNTMEDPRYNDCALVGMIHDKSVEDIVGLFSQGSKQRAEAIRAMYGRSARDWSNIQTFTDERMEAQFLHTDNPHNGMQRVIEVWRKESRTCYWVHDRLNGEYYADFETTEAELKAENVARVLEQSSMGVADEDMLLLEYEYGTDTSWRYYYLTSWGDVLDSGDNPFHHGLPPFTWEIHNFYIGKIYPFVSALIPTQKQINKLNAISELLSKYSAKSLLFMPIEQIADEHGYGLEYIEDKMTSYDAVIPYKSKPGMPAPNAMNTMGDAFTPLNVVNLYLRLSEQVSGVYGALQGQQPTSGTPAQMYAQQSQNSATSLNDVFEALNSYRVKRDKMNVQLMQQYYDEPRWIFDKDGSKYLRYDPKRIKNIESEITVIENTNTPAYRLMLTDMLFKLKEYDVQNQLDLRAMIEVGNLPFRDTLLDYLNKREQEMRESVENGMLAQGNTSLDPQLAEQISQYQFNPDLIQEHQQIDPRIFQN